MTPEYADLSSEPETWMIYRQLKLCDSVFNKHNPSTKSDWGACISSRITTVIHVMNDHQINYNCFDEPFAVSPYRSLYWDTHGLIFETSIWLLAGSTRFVKSYRWQLQLQERMEQRSQNSSNKHEVVHNLKTQRLNTSSKHCSARGTYHLTPVSSTCAVVENNSASNNH